jgi:ferrous iron transport protein A
LGLNLKVVFKNANVSSMNLAELPVGAVALVLRIAGSGSYRRRLMELGILPGTRVELVRVAPLGDPLELLVRGASLSIRRAEALRVEVQAAARLEATDAREAQTARLKTVDPCAMRGPA